jgi:hypothetical protein
MCLDNTILPENQCSLYFILANVQQLIRFIRFHLKTNAIFTPKYTLHLPNYVIGMNYIGAGSCLEELPVAGVAQQERYCLTRRFMVAKGS